MICSFTLHFPEYLDNSQIIIIERFFVHVILIMSIYAKLNNDSVILYSGAI